MNDTIPSLRDDYSRLIMILAAAPHGGISLDEIQQATITGEKWSLRTINDLLCGLGNNMVAHEKIRTKSGKVTKYSLRSTN